MGVDGWNYNLVSFDHAILINYAKRSQTGDDSISAHRQGDAKDDTWI